MRYCLRMIARPISCRKGNRKSQIRGRVAAVLPQLHLSLSRVARQQKMQGLELVALIPIQVQVLIQTPMQVRVQTQARVLGRVIN